jgi:nucleoside-diphosphate-sugar epimerase
MKALIIGGTRNLGPSLAQALLDDGYRVAVFNRGIAPGALPAGVERLYGDRCDARQLREALGSREFDLVVDTTLYNGPDAESVVRVLGGRVGRYVFLSTGQVYLVRVGLQPPFRESDYDGEVMPEPPFDHRDHEEWVYGADKRAAEAVFQRAWESASFPFTTLRLPMVNSELDHHDRIYGYWLRLRDGGPIVAPEVAPDRPALPLRHVYGGDAVQAIRRCINVPASCGRAYNISQEETLSLEAFLDILAAATGLPLRIARVPRERLEAEGLLPACSPFSGRWMSVLDNQCSKVELGMTYTPVQTYVERLVKWHESQPLREIDGYKRRPEELVLAEAG